MMPGSLQIVGHRFHMGTGLLQLEITQEYGFAADGLVADLAFEAVRDLAPAILTREIDEKVAVEARLELLDGPVRFSGFLDEVNQTLSNQPLGEASTVNLSARSILRDVLDDIPTNLLTGHYWQDADWSEVVADVVRRLGFTTGGIEASGLLAGEQQGRRYLYVVNDKQPREVVQEAVDATGFVANVLPDRTFTFQRPETIRLRPAPMFVMLVGDPTSQVRDLQAIEHNVTELQADRQVRVPPGAPLILQVPRSPKLSGRYYAEKSRYQGSALEDQSNLVNFNVVRDLPDLRKEA